MTSLRARLFGGFELTDGNGTELKLSTRKTRALLAFLIVEAGRWHTRERLASLLWSDRQQAQSRHSLTQALGTIRKLGETAGEQLIESDSERVRLLAQSIEADVLTFREAASSDASAAAECYTGPLLDGFVAPDELFEEWLLAERAACHGVACSALRSLAGQQEASNDPPAAIAAAERLLVLDPLDETEHRRLMRLYADSGNRSEAIRQYEKCERLLTDELGVEPSHETTALLETVRSQNAPTTSRQLAPGPSVEVAQDVATRTFLDRPSIAVLPFENLSRDPEQEYFADGMAEDLITALSRFRSLIVIPRNSTFSFKGQVPDLQHVARELAARYVLEGSVRRAGDRIRISAQLIDTSTGDHLWADRFDRSLNDIFVVQDEVANGIISAIAPEIDKVERNRAQRTPPESLDAWSLYQCGLTSYHATTRDGLQSAIGSFDQATKLDPNFAAAYALAADARIRLLMHFSPDQLGLLNEAAEKSRIALALDNRDPVCHLADARVHSYLGQHGRAIAEARDAVSLNPTSAMCHHALGFVLGRAGKVEEAIPCLERAVELGPRDIFLPGYLTFGSAMFYLCGRYEEAASWARRACSSFNPRSGSFHFLVAALVKLGKLDEVKVALSELLSRTKGSKTLDGFRKSLSVNLPGTPEGNLDCVNALREAGLPEDEPNPRNADLSGESQLLQPPDRPSIAVLPFDNLSNDPEQEFLADGMAEDIIAGLSKFHWLFVIARNSSFAYKGKSPDVRDVARDLGVRYVLEGSVRRSAAHVRISAQLVDAETGSHIWVERYDRELADIFAVQDEVTAAIVSNIAPQIGQSEIERVRRRPPESLDAWALFQQGMALYPSGASKDFQTAIALFDRARNLDPGFVEAWAMAGHMRTRSVSFFPTDSREATLNEAHEILLTAMRLNPNDATCNMALGRWHVARQEPEFGVEYCREAVSLNPNSVLAHFELGIALHNAGQYEEALLHYETARRLSPRDLHAAALSTGPSFTLYQLGRFEEAAVNAARVSRSPNPRYWADALLVAALTRLGRQAEAEEAKIALLNRKPDFSIKQFGSSTPALRTPELLSALREADLPE